MIKNIIIDFKRTIYDPENDVLLVGAYEGLNLLKQKGFYLRLVGKGTEKEITTLLEKFKLNQFFDEVCIDDDKEKFFRKVESPSSWLVIGDRAWREILYGGQLGMKTMWLRNGKFSTEEPTEDQKSPDYIVSSWEEIIEIIKNLSTSQVDK